MESCEEYSTVVCRNRLAKCNPALLSPLGMGWETKLSNQVTTSYRRHDFHVVQGVLSLLFLLLNAVYAELFRNSSQFL
jgi:hypothetical protein